MTTTNIASMIVETLDRAGVKRIFGIVGDSLYGLTEALRVQDTIDWVHVRHEEVAALAAAGEAQVTGELAVCAGSCGPGNLHLINGLLDAHRSRTPVLAIAAQIPSSEIGGGYFQETHPQNLFVSGVLTPFFDGIGRGACFREAEGSFGRSLCLVAMMM